MRDNEADTSRTLGDIHDAAVEAGHDGIDAIKVALADPSATIQAAINKLETARSTAIAGPWTIFSDRYTRHTIIVRPEEYDDDYLSDRQIHRDGAHAEDSGGFDANTAELIVILHRTIDAQLQLFESALWLLKGHPMNYTHAAVHGTIELAKAILGESR